MVAKRLREHKLYSRTIQLKLRYRDFTTITRAHSLDHGTQFDGDLIAAVLDLLQRNWDGATPVRLLGVHAGSLKRNEGQMSLLDEPAAERLRSAFRAIDKIRDRFGVSSISLARSMQTNLREKTHENPYDLPGKAPQEKEESIPPARKPKN
jgi:DNA polymerase-4